MEHQAWMKVCFSRIVPSQLLRRWILSWHVLLTHMMYGLVVTIFTINSGQWWGLGFYAPAIVLPLWLAFKLDSVTALSLVPDLSKGLENSWLIGLPVVLVILFGMAGFTLFSEC